MTFPDPQTLIYGWMWNGTRPKRAKHQHNWCSVARNYLFSQPFHDLTARRCDRPLAHARWGIGGSNRRSIYKPAIVVELGIEGWRFKRQEVSLNNNGSKRPPPF